MRTVTYSGECFEVVFDGVNDGADGDLLLLSRRQPDKRPGAAPGYHGRQPTPTEDDNARVLRALHAHPEQPVNAVAQRCGLSYHRTRTAIGRLMVAGRIRIAGKVQIGNSRRVVYFYRAVQPWGALEA